MLEPRVGLDSAALIGFDAAVSLYGVKRNASAVYVRTDLDGRRERQPWFGGRFT